MRLALTPLLIAFALSMALGCGSAESFEGGVRIPTATGAGASWSPDGRWIAIPNRKGVLLRDVESGARKQLAAPPLRRALGAMPGRIAWSADGRELRYVTNVGPAEHSGGWVTTVSVDGAAAEQIALGTSLVTFDWAPAGRPLVYATGPYAFSVSGPIGPAPAIWSVPGPGAASERLLDLPGEEREPRFSPDGRTLSFVYERRERSPAIGLWLVSSDGSGPHPLVPRLLSCEPSWSPDGRTIAFAGTTLGGDRRLHLYVVPASGGPMRQVTDDELRAGDPPAWTPGGNRLTYATYEGEIKSVRPDGRGERTIADLRHREVRDLMWSPDGEHLAYSAAEIAEPD